jgi:hypothetical protein
MGGSASPPTSPSDLADYAYCPRSHWYRHHPPVGGPSSDGRRRSAHGEQYHDQTLRGVRRRAEHGAAYAAVVVAGILLVLGGIAWLLH